VAAVPQEPALVVVDQSGQKPEVDDSAVVALVIVLDAASDELVQVVGYLQSINGKIDIDLVTVSAGILGLRAGPQSRTCECGAAMGKAPALLGVVSPAGSLAAGSDCSGWPVPGLSGRVQSLVIFV